MPMKLHRTGKRKTTALHKFRLFGCVRNDLGYPCIRSAVKNPASLAKPGQARLSGFLAKLTGKMRPGKAWQAWPRPSFLGNLGHKSPAFSAMLVPRPDFLGNLGQKKKLGFPGH